MEVYISEGIVRFYSKGNWCSKSPYSAVMSYVPLTRDIVYVYAFCGRMNRELYEELYESLKARGFTLLMYERSEHFSPPMREEEQVEGSLWKIQL